MFRFNNISITCLIAFVVTVALAEPTQFTSAKHRFSALIPEGRWIIEETFGNTALELSRSNILDEYARISLVVDSIPKGKIPIGFDIWTLKNEDILKKLQKSSTIFGEKVENIGYGREIIDGIHVIWRIAHGWSIEHGMYPRMVTHEHVFEGVRNKQYITIRLISVGDSDWFIENQVEFSRFIHSIDFFSSLIGSSVKNNEKNNKSIDSFWEALSKSFIEQWVKVMGAIIFISVAGALLNKLKRSKPQSIALTVDTPNTEMENGHTSSPLIKGIDMQNSRNRHNQNSPSHKTSPIGLSGWLIIPAIGLVFAPIKTVIMEILGIKMLLMFFPEILLDIRFWFILILDVVLIIAFIVVANMFFRKRFVAMRGIILLMLASIGVNIIQFILNTSIFDELTYDVFKPVLHATVFAAVWIPYFKKSRRVKNTFIN